MANFQQSKNAKGIALVFALLILLILTILGVASMSNVAIQERMSGNANLQALAFKAASSGVPGSIEFGTDQANWGGNAACNSEWSPQPNWYPTWEPVVTVSGVAAESSGVVAEFRRQARCIEDDELRKLGVADIQSQLYVRIEGRVRRSGDQPATAQALSTRQIEVLIDRRGGITESAIRVEGSARITADTPNSSNFLVDGGTGGVAISASTIENRDIIRESVHKNRVNQYRPNPPGIVENDYRSPWNNPKDLAKIMNELRNNLIACGPGGVGFVDGGSCYVPDDPADACEPSDFEGCLVPPFSFDLDYCLYYNGDVSRNGNGSGLGVETPASFKLHFVDGNLDLGGGSDNYGLIISTGTLRMSGNANLTGKAIALGGLFQLYGGGGEESNGGIFLTNLNLDADFDADPPPDFGASTLDLSGGGDHQVYYDCGEVNKALALFARCGVADAPPLANCTNGAAGGGTRDVIASWRENFGWRETL